MEFPSKFDFSKTIIFDDHWIAEAYEVIDTPTNDGSRLIGMVNQMMYDVRSGPAIMQSREQIKKVILKAISEFLDDAFSQHDLIDGYSKKELE